MSETGVKKHVVRLSAEERAALEAMISKGKGPASQLLKARVLLKADISDAGDGWSDERIVEALETSLSTVYRTRQLLVEDGLDAALKRKPRERPSITPIFDGEAEARLIQLACSEAPAGHARWTLRLLEQKVVELGIVPRASDNTIGRVLKKTFLKPHLKEQWVIPPAANAAFVAAMEDVLTVYTLARDQDCPLVCLDETSKQLTRETRTPKPMRRGQPARVDYEYERNGTANLFMLFAPLEGWRHVEVTDHRTAVDYAHILKDLSDRHFPSARRIRLVQDNLNTHTIAALYEAFPPAEARRIAERFELHYTPKHGSWLNMAESELGVLASQCLDRRIPDKECLGREVTAWQTHRNLHHAKANWQFTTADARIKLRRLYPSL
nr:IS630 family transposase [uncultured Rhodopila sp.]